MGGSENVQKLAYVIYEWYLAWARACSCMPKHLSWGLEAVFWPHFFSFACLFTSLSVFLFKPYSSVRKKGGNIRDPNTEGEILGIRIQRGKYQGSGYRGGNDMAPQDWWNAWSGSCLCLNWQLESNLQQTFPLHFQEQNIHWKRIRFCFLQNFVMINEFSRFYINVSMLTYG